jgi:hypothetical protein
MRSALIVVAGLALLTGTLGHSVTTAQEAAPAASAAAIDGLAGRLVVELQKAGVKKVAIFDLRSFEGKHIAFGGWLGDRISEDVARAGAKIQVADRSGFADFADVPMDDAELYRADREKKVRLAKSVKADAYVDGTVGAIGDAIGVSLVAMRVKGE